MKQENFRDLTKNIVVGAFAISFLPEALFFFSERELYNI